MPRGEKCNLYCCFILEVTEKIIKLKKISGFWNFFGGDFGILFRNFSVFWGIFLGDFPPKVSKILLTCLTVDSAVSFFFIRTSIFKAGCSYYLIVFSLTETLRVSTIFLFGWRKPNFNCRMKKSFNVIIRRK